MRILLTLQGTEIEISKSAPWEREQTSAVTVDGQPMREGDEYLLETDIDYDESLRDFVVENLQEWRLSCQHVAQVCFFDLQAVDNVPESVFTRLGWLIETLKTNVRKQINDWRLKPEGEE